MSYLFPLFCANLLIETGAFTIQFRRSVILFYSFTLAAQARGVLGSTLKDCQSFVYFRLITSKFLYFQREARSSEQNPHFCIKCGYKCAVQICNHCLVCSTLSLDLLFFWLKHEDCSGFVRDLTVKINAQNTKNCSVDQSHRKTIQPG